MQNEEALVQKAQQRDRQAFALLYEAYFDKIYRYVFMKVNSQTEAEDVTQQVFLKALESISSFKWQGFPFSAWLYRIAHNQIVDYIRKKTKEAPSYGDDPPNVKDTKPDSDPHSVTERNMSAEQLARAMNKLPEAQREVLSLRFTSGLSTAEVAGIMGRTPGAVKTLQHSAISSLRKIFLADNNE